MTTSCRARPDPTIEEHPLSHAFRSSLVRLATSARRAQWRLRPGEWTLNELALLHGADKSSAAHDFASIYETYFHAWRAKPITILEVGVWRGVEAQAGGEE